MNKCRKLGQSPNTMHIFRLFQFSTANPRIGSFRPRILWSYFSPVYVHSVILLRSILLLVSFVLGVCWWRTCTHVRSPYRIPVCFWNINKLNCLYFTKTYCVFFYNLDSKRMSLKDFSTCLRYLFMLSEWNSKRIKIFVAHGCHCLSFEVIWVNLNNSLILFSKHCCDLVKFPLEIWLHRKMEWIYLRIFLRPSTWG